MFTAVLLALSVTFGPAILDVSLQMDDTARQSLEKTPDSDVPATMTLRNAGRQQSYAVMVHVKGQLGSKRPLDDKPAFKIKLAKGERALGLEHLTFNNMVQDPTMLHEAVGYQVYAAAGVPVPNTGYVRLAVDGEDKGLYLNLETIDRLFLERAFHDSGGILYEGAYGVDLREGDEKKFQLHEGTDPNHAQLTALIRAVHAPSDDVFYGSTAQVDTPSFVAMMAAGALLADWDNYYAANNYRIYWRPSARRWSFIPTGIDQTFSSGSTTLFGGIGILFQKCLASDRCTSDYAKALRDVSVHFERLDLAAKMDALLSVISPASKADPKKPYDDEAMQNARDAMRKFITTHPAHVRKALSCMDDGGASALTACAGHVVMNAALDGCLELVSPSPGQHGAAARVGTCHGGPKQRWQMVATGDAFALKALTNGECLDVSAGAGDAGVHPAACTGAESQLFTVQTGHDVTALVARSSGQCLAPAPGESKTPAVAPIACAAEPAQQWRLQRSIFGEPRLQLPPHADR